MSVSLPVNTQILTAEEVWAACLSYIQTQLKEETYSKWFPPFKAQSFDGEILVIQAPSNYFIETLEDKFLDLLSRTINHVIGPNGRLEYTILLVQGYEPVPHQVAKKSASVPNTVAQAASMLSDSGNSSTSFSPFQAVPVNLDIIEESHLNSIYSFDNYVEGDCNKLARSAGMAVATRPGGNNSFNPLMIYGGVGLGKTHLVQAIGNKIKATLPEKLIVYVSAERFTTQFIDALASHNANAFLNYYMQVDVLILDDVHGLSGKDATQEIFFQIFNHLYQRNKQIILTSDKPPREIKGLTERLINRMNWGLTADLHQPDFETRVAIVQQKMNNEGVIIPSEIVHYIAQSVEHSIRELEGVLISLIFEVSIHHAEFNMDLARKAVNRVVNRIETMDIDYIQKSVSEYFQIPKADLMGKTRKKEISTARHVAMYFAKTFTNFSLKAIGEHFGGRDHTTVMHAIDKVRNDLERDAKFKAAMMELQNRFNGS
jgi:chromosomal replication initiator protein